MAMRSAVRAVRIGSFLRGIATLAVPVAGAAACAVGAGDGRAAAERTGATAEADLTPDGPVFFAETCGDGVRGPHEQCDDGNLVDLDGCDGACRFEQIQRVNALEMQFGTDADCAVNALGGAMSSLARAQAQAPYDAAVADGSISILFRFGGLADLAGQSGASTIGVISASPELPSGAAYDGTHDLDGWYTAAAASIDAARHATETVPATFSGGTMSLGPAPLHAAIRWSGVPVTLAFTDAVVRLPVGATSAPLGAAGTGGARVGHLATERLDPALVSFASMGAGATGRLCGHLSARSLAEIPVPAALLSGFTRCNEGYTSSNSLLDVYVGGCHATFASITVVAPTQPDGVDPAAAPIGGVPAVALTTGAGRTVDGCSAGGVAASRDACLDRATYSTYFHVATERVIVR